MEERTEAMVDLKKEQAEREARTLDMERLGKDLDTACYCVVMMMSCEMK